MSSSYHVGRWAPLVLPEVAPLAMLRPRAVPLTFPLGLSASAASFAAFGLGPVSSDVRWMWRWDGDGVLRLFRSWTGFEVYRVTLRPAGLTPVTSPPAWEVTSVDVESHPARVSPASDDDLLDVLHGVLSDVESLRGVLDGVPADLPSALAATVAPNAPWPPRLPLLAQELQACLPQRLEGLWLRDRSVPLVDDLVVETASAHGDVVRLDVRDGSVLWVHQPWRGGPGWGGLAFDTGGALLWPGPRWRRALPRVAAWGVLRQDGGGVLETLRDDEGDRINPDDVAREVWGRADSVVEIRFSGVDRHGRKASESITPSR